MTKNRFDESSSIRFIYDIHPINQLLSYEDAHIACEQLNLDNTDSSRKWVMPTINELKAIMTRPKFAAKLLENIYWSSQMYVSDDDKAITSDTYVRCLGTKMGLEFSKAKYYPFYTCLIQIRNEKAKSESTTEEIIDPQSESIGTSGDAESIESDETHQTICEGQPE